jgi:hypothetical protein
LRQAAAVGVVASQVLVNLLERVEALEAAQQQPHQDKLDRLIALDRGDDEPTPEAAPVATLSDALISAEAALSDIAEGEETNAAPNTFEWAEQRCAEALAIIRPVMQQHGIRTSEFSSTAQPAPQPAHPSHGNSEYTDQEWAEIKRWRQQPPASQPAPPAAPAGGLLERVCGEMTGDDDPSIDARAAIREVAEWLDQQGQHGCSLLLREEAGR